MKNFDSLLLWPILVLAGISLATVWSVAPELVDDQAMFFLFGAFLLFLTASIDYRILENLWWVILVTAVILLLITFIFGEPVRGAVRWVGLPGGLRLQFSEIVKPLFILSLAGFMSQEKTRHEWRRRIGDGNIGQKFLLKTRTAVSFLIFLVPILLVARQPDLGNALIYLIILVALLLAVGLPLPLFIVGLSLVIGALPLGWGFLEEYQRLRIISFVNPGFDPQGAGYNAIQAMIAVGSGQILGRGLGRGTQSHLRFLPERHTDFIFATLAEELGLVGGLILILTFSFLLFRLLKVIEDSEVVFGKLVALGVATMFFSQVFINLGMNMGLLPVTGITLPLVSYGGSSIVASMMALGFVESLKIQTKKKESALRIR